MPEGLADATVVLDHTVLPKFEPPCTVFTDGQVVQAPSTPSEFFAIHFPSCVSKFGSAVLERRRAFADGSVKITPVSINEDTLAAVLGMEQCGTTVYHETEMQFYCRDNRTNFFNPVDAEYLKLVLSQIFLKCIAQMPGAVEVEPLFNQFRSDHVLDRIIQRAKAVLGVEDEFFSEAGQNSRNPIKVPKEAARAFVDRCIEVDEAAVLPLRDAFEAYQQFCKVHGYLPVHINQFRPFVAPHIQRRFNRGVRNDLNVFGSSKALGWRGLRLRTTQSSE